MQIEKLFLVFTVAAFLLSCTKSSQQNTRPSLSESNGVQTGNLGQFDPVEFERNKKLWRGANIRNYQMAINLTGYLTSSGGDSVLVEVKEGYAVAVKSLSKPGDKYLDPYKTFDTVEKIFDYVELEHSRKAQRLEVRYDPTLGYPNSIILDEQFGLSDDELSLKVSNFERIE